MEKHSSKTGVIIAAIVALVIGGVAGYAISMNMKDDSNTLNENTNT